MQPTPSSPKKKLKTAGIVLGVLVTIFLVGFAANSFAMKQLDKNIKSDEQCAKVNGTDYTITIENNVARPGHVDGKQCDTLTVLNKDSNIRKMAFGKHDKHTPYNGVSQTTLLEDQSFKVYLNQLGTGYIIHDHDDQKVRATFSVTAR